MPTTADFHLLYNFVICMNQMNPVSYPGHEVMNEDCMCDFCLGLTSEIDDEEKMMNLANAELGIDNLSL